ncbi:TPA: hypothetical protein DE059_01390 [Candidatus Peribacteria bacterium]|nr:hypothetical protein [Candidatus Peribacteria bacterium]|tara:strand:- start:16308 stop:16556 length:249 start_codon:yes stop_codon:yes gene_type:complete
MVLRWYQPIVVAPKWATNFLFDKIIYLDNLFGTDWRKQVNPATAGHVNPAEVESASWRIMNSGPSEYQGGIFNSDGDIREPC